MTLLQAVLDSLSNVARQHALTDGFLRKHEDSGSRALTGAFGYTIGICAQILVNADLTDRREQLQVNKIATDLLEKYPEDKDVALVARRIIAKYGGNQSSSVTTPQHPT